MFELRDYQKDCVAAINDGWKQTDRQMFVLPTGMGKTEIFVEEARMWEETSNWRVLVICPSIELVAQAASKLCKRTGIWPGIEQGEMRSNEHEMMRSPFVVATKATLMGPSRRLERIRDVGLVIVDECHLSATAAYDELLAYYAERGAKILGCTATPNRHDETALSNIYDQCCFTMGINEGIEQGWLVSPKVNTITIKSLDLSSVSTYGKEGDFKQAALGHAMEDAKVVHEIAEITMAESADKKTAIYCASVLEAKQVAELMQDRGRKADWICADTRQCDENKRNRVLKKFAEPDGLQFVANVGILTTGWDLDILDHIVVARPTKSLGLYTQIIGRGTRPLEGLVDFEGSTPESRRQRIAESAKPHFTVTDLVDASKEHKLITPIDVLGGNEGLPIRQKAHKLASEEDISVVEALEQAKREAEEEARRLIAQQQARVEYAKKNINPFMLNNLGEVKPLDTSGYKMPWGKYKGRLLKNIPADYLRWAMEQEWMEKHKRLRAEIVGRFRKAIGLSAKKESNQTTDQDLDEAFQIHEHLKTKQWEDKL